MNKKKIIATASAIALAAVMAFGGTLAYYQGQVESPVENTLVDQGNNVSISESDVDGNGSTQSNTYSIIPGTTDKKDPVVTAEYTLDSYVYVTVSDETGTWITWDPASAWTLLDGYDNVYYLLLKTVQYDSGSSDWTSSTTDGSTTYTYTGTTETGYTYSYDGSGTYTVSKDNVELYTYTVTTSTNNSSSNPIDVYTAKIHVIEDDTISYSSSITNDTYAGYGQIISLDFGAYIIQADIAGSDDVNESALSCWNALNASTSTSSVNAGNVAVTTETTTDDEGNETSTITTSEQLVVTSADSAHSATVPSGVTIDTDTADIVTDSDGNTTTTLILVVKEVGNDYTSDSLKVSVINGQIATVYDVSIIGVDSANTTVMEIAMNIGTGLENVSVEHESSNMVALSSRTSSSSYTDQAYYYNSESGILYIYTDTFSEFAVKYDAVARVGDVTYTTLDAALNAAGVGETVTLLADIAATSAVTYSDSGKSIALDLNGHTITNTNTTDSYVLVVSGGTLTIADSTGAGAISGNASSQVGVQLTAGTLNVTSGTVSGSSGILTSGGTLNVSGGAVKGLSSDYETVSLTYDKTAVNAYKDTVDSLTAVNGSGIFIVAGKDNTLAVNISGGSISTTDYENNHDICVVKLTSGTNLGVRINVTGGTFGGDSGDFDNCYLAYDWENDEEYSWITLNTGNCEFGSTAGKYKISGGTGLMADWIGVSGTTLY